MNLFAEKEKVFARAVSRLGYCNPFLPDRIHCEKEVLGDAFVERDLFWSKKDDLRGVHPNIEKISQQVELLVEELRDRLSRDIHVKGQELSLYEDLVLYMLYNRNNRKFDPFILRDLGKKTEKPTIPFYREFSRDFDRFFGIPDRPLPNSREAPHLFACFFQVRRAFHHIYNHIIGESMPAARLRGAVWQSIFTHDMRRYRRVLYKGMEDVSSLVTGPSGTGKELVAQAIALSRYIPFDALSETFIEDFTTSFFAVNLSALSPTLIESELFGHRRGAFTGALHDRAGWLEVCPPQGTVFLDEIGEIEPSIQVKLLRVLQNRVFQRLGETKNRTFKEKIISSTNRDLAEEMLAGRFREDLYYRLCSDRIVTPSLYDQIQDSPQALAGLISYISRSIVGDEEAESLAGETRHWIGQNLGSDYLWPGNVRELEQCVRNILIRKEYYPARTIQKRADEELAETLTAGSITADELLRRYCTMVYASTGSYQETARRLKLDHRTVKSRLDRDLLKRLKEVVW